MSCQQAPKFITTSSSASVTPEDPYVFTETLPSTPPFLFNTQKSRSRFIDVQQSTRVTSSARATTATTQTTATTVATKATPVVAASEAPTNIVAHTKSISKSPKLPLAPLNEYIAKAPASLGSSVVGGAGAAAATATATANLCKNAAKSQKQNDLQNNNNSITINNNNNKNNYNNNNTSNSCKSSHGPKKALANLCILRAEQQHQHQHQHQFQQETSPLLQHTPSLWQTPLLLDTAIPMVSPPTSPASLPSPTLAQPAQPSPDSAVTTSLAVPAIATLPPSNFHHTTVAQHLQKVQSLKKVIKSTGDPEANSMHPTQHSHADLNDIPVNVIFRKPQLDLAGSGERQQHHTQQQEEEAATVTEQNAADIEGAALSTGQQQQQQHLIMSTPPTSESEPHMQFPILTQQTSLSHAAECVAPAPSFPLVAETSSSIASPHPLDNPVTSSPCSETATVAASLASQPLQSANRRTPPTVGKGIRKTRKAISLRADSPIEMPVITRHEYVSCRRTSSAVAVVRIREPKVDVDSSHLASTSAMPYALQRHWFHEQEVPSKLRHSREERIGAYKDSLRQQAMQLISTHKLQRLPYLEARQRLVCVDQLVRKYQQTELVDLPAKKCSFESCTQSALEMASFCRQHISHNAAQQIFLQCQARAADSTPCRMSVFNVEHEVALCAKHEHDRSNYLNIERSGRLEPFAGDSGNSISALTCQSQGHLDTASVSAQDEAQSHSQPQPKLQSQPLQFPRKLAQQQQFTYFGSHKAGEERKRRVNSDNQVVGRPQKRSKKAMTMLSTTPPPLSAGLTRKSSTTSLESIASSSQSSSWQTPSLSLAPLQQQLQSQPQPLPQSQSQPQCQLLGNSLALPTLAPLSHGLDTHAPPAATQHQSQNPYNLDALTTPMGAATITAADDLKEHEINEIVAQFASVANGGGFLSNSLGQGHKPNNQQVAGLNFGCVNVNSDSNFTSALGSSSSLPSTDELLTQDMLSICENSSAYASSEDTGLGGLSETELISGAHDADDIPLVDTRLLEEQDLANVLSTLPVDAFNEIFNTVRQDEYDEVERALELADKHLKSLQQTIGDDSDFLGDLLSDEFINDADICNKMEIVSSVMHTPDTSDIDPASLFMDSSHGSVGMGVTSADSGNTTSTCPTTAADVRGLVQT